MNYRKRLKNTTSPSKIKSLRKRRIFAKRDLVNDISSKRLKNTVSNIRPPLIPPLLKPLNYNFDNIEEKEE